MIRQNNNAPFSQRQLRVGELIKQSLGQIFLRDEAKVPTLETKNITVTEVRMSPDLKNARAYVIPLGGNNITKDICSQQIEEEEGGGKGGLVKIILIVLGVLLLVAITIVGTLFAVGFFDEKPPEEDPEVE